MPGMTPKEPPIKAYPLLKPDKRRQVDAVPAAERDVLAWLLLLAAGQDNWCKRKHPCLVCEKSGWPCLDPRSPGNSIRCEGCYLAGYHCQTIPSRLEPSTPAKNTNVGSTPKDKDSGSSDRKKRMIRRRVYSSESDSDSQSSVSDARRKSPKNDKTRKRNRTESSPATPQQVSSSDIEFIAAYEPEETTMTPTPPRELSYSPQVNTTPTSPTNSTNTAEEFFQELFGHYTSTDEDNSDRSDSAPLPPRPLPILPVPALHAPGPTTKVTAPDSGETRQPTARLETPSDGQFELSGYSDRYDDPFTPGAAPSWKSSSSRPIKEPGKELSESSAGINPTGEDTEEDELELDVKEEQEEFCGQAPDSSLKQQYDKADASDASKAPSPEETTQQPPSSTPIVLNSLQQLSVLVVYQIPKAAQDTAHPSFALSFNGEKAGSGGKTMTTVIVVPAARNWTGEMVPWHILLCERGTNGVMVIFNSQELDQAGLYSTSALTKTLPQGYLNELEVPKSPQAILWKPCKRLEGISGPVWTTCLAIWLTWGGDLHEKLENLSSVSIREQFVIPQFNSLLQRKKLASTCISVN